MTRRRGLAGAVAVGFAAALGGCGFGPGPSSSGTATLTVTRDYGSRTLVHATDAGPPESETVVRLLDREAQITTRYGGRFVQSIDGVGGAERGGRRYDWFFYVNGIESPVGAADVRVRGGDRIWWDYRDWTNAMRVPAVVGSWPEPFAQASTPAAERLPVRVECATGRPVCRLVADRLARAGVDAAIDPFGTHRGGNSLELLVGPWRAIRRDPAASLRGPAASGVFATFKGSTGERYQLIVADPHAQPRQALGPHAGLVASVSGGAQPPTWLVTGTDVAGVRTAADHLDVRDLRDRYAVAAPAHGAPFGVPVRPAEGGS